MSGEDHAGRDAADDGGAELELDIQSPGFSEVEPPPGVDPHHDRSVEVVAAGRPRRTLRLYVHAAALEEVLHHVREEVANEVGGVLLGRLYMSRGKLVTEVTEGLRAPLTHTGMAHVTFSHDTWAAIFEHVDRAGESAIVGWYHSHPGFGIFLSRPDVFIHENFFDGKGHVALVLDPVGHDIGAFGWQRGRVVPAKGFWIVAPHGHEELARHLAGLLHYREARREIKPPGLLGRLRARFRRR